MNEQEQTTSPADAPVQPNVQQEAAQTAPTPERPTPEASASSPSSQTSADAVEKDTKETDSGSETIPSQCKDVASSASSVMKPTATEPEPTDNEENDTDSNSANPSNAEPSSGVDVEKAVADIAGRLGEVLSSMQSMTERISAIETAFPILRKDVLSLAKSVSGLYTTTTDRMHAKIEKYDRGLEQTIAKPYLLSIAKIGDALRRSIASAEANPENALTQLQSLKDDIRVPLWNAGLRVIDIAPGVTAFNPRLHDGIDIVGTGDKTLDGIVESVVETGYLFAPETDDPNARPRVFRAALVKVFKFDKTLEAPIPSFDDQPSSVN